MSPKPFSFCPPTPLALPQYLPEVCQACCAHLSRKDQKERQKRRGHSYWQGFSGQQSRQQDRRGRPVTPERVHPPCLPPSQQDHLPSLEFWFQRTSVCRQTPAHTRPVCFPGAPRACFPVAHQGFPICFHGGSLSHGFPPDISQFLSLLAF